MTIDAHHHFWKYNPAEYGWIDEDMASIRRDFLPADLKREIAAAGVDAVVSVQARQSLAETRWLLDLAAANDFIAGVVGWAPLIAPSVADDLDTLLATARGKLVSVRHVLQCEPDENYMLGDGFTTGLRQLAPRNLAYDILIFERQLRRTIQFVDRHPNQVFVLDHLAKPRIRDWAMSPWRENIRELARRENVYIKISGMVTEADYRAWSGEQLRPYVDVILDAFGPRRIMFGSDWPVCLVACGYARWASLVRSFIIAFSPTEQADIMGNTARRAYRLQLRA
jgi:L-fuconolactonase